MEMKMQTDGSVSVLQVEGEIDLSSSPQLRDRMLEALGQRSLDVNLSDTTYIDSSGVATLVEGLKRSQKVGNAFRILAPSEPVMKVLRLARLDSLFTIVLSEV